MEKQKAHQLLFRNGLSLDYTRLAGSAIKYWQTMLITSTRLLGNAHPDAVVARDKLAAAYESAGRFGDAISVFQNALVDREPNHGSEHPHSITSRDRLAHTHP